MSKSRFKRKGGPKHVRLYEWLLRSSAWQSLDPVARQLYVELKRRYDGLNNGRIGFGCREAAEALNIGKDTANRAFVKLEDRGFIAVTRRAGFNVKNRVATEWLLTEYPNDINGDLASRDFMKWRPSEKSTVAPQATTVASQGPLPSERAA